MLPIILAAAGTYLIVDSQKDKLKFEDGGETKYHVKVSESLSQKSMNEILKIQLKKLEDYKQKGYTKERLVELNKFSKSWLDKHYEDGGVVNAKNQEFLKRFISTKISSDKEKFIMKYLKDIDIDIKTTPYKILKSFVKQANRYYESEMVKTLPYKKYEIRYQIPFGAKYSTEIIARTPNEARKDFLSYNRKDKIISVTLSKNKIKDVMI
jgi:hypothetical protein